MKKILLTFITVLLFNCAKSQVYQLVADTTFGVTGPLNFDFHQLVPGEHYKLTMSGLWRDYGGADYDTHYAINPSFYDFGYSYFVTSPAWLPLLAPSPAGYDTSHVYNFYFTGDTSMIHIDFSDNGYTDNSGSVTVQLFQECQVTHHPVVADTAACFNSGITLKANGYSNYTWYDQPAGGNVLSSDSTLIIPALLQADTVYVSTTLFTGCMSDRDTVIINVDSLPLVSFDLSTTMVCESSAPFALTDGSPAGGIYSGAGVSANNFDPSSVSAGDYTLTYTYTSLQGCTSSDTSALTVSLCTSVKEEQAADHITLFPDPNNGQFYLKIENVKSDYSLKVYDELGALVYSENLSSSITEKAITIDQPSGIYFMQVLSGEKTISQKRFIISK